MQVDTFVFLNIIFFLSSYSTRVGTVALRVGVEGEGVAILLFRLVSNS